MSHGRTKCGVSGTVNPLHSQAPLFTRHRLLINILDIARRVVPVDYPISIGNRAL